MVKVSVVMPVFNTNPSHLRDAIESVLAQSFTDFEFIILNDSPDNKNIRAVVGGYIDARIRYVENEQNLGIAKSYNRLVDLAKTNYVAIMNHDDISLPNRIEMQYQYMQQHPDVGIVGTAYKKFGELNRFRKIYPRTFDKHIRAALLFKSSIHHPTSMIRKDILVKHNIRYNENFISLNDRQLYYEISKVAKLANLGIVLFKYRFHKNMVSKNMKDAIAIEQQTFHDMWFRENGVVLSEKELDVFDKYIACGRSKIRNRDVLVEINNILEKIVEDTKRSPYIKHDEFAQICADYMLKKTLSAAIYGKVNSDELIKNSKLNVKQDMRSKILNLALKWVG